MESPRKTYVCVCNEKQIPVFMDLGLKLLSGKTKYDKQSFMLHPVLKWHRLFHNGDRSIIVYKKNGWFYQIGLTIPIGEEKVWYFTHFRGNGTSLAEQPLTWILAEERTCGLRLPIMWRIYVTNTAVQAFAIERMVRLGWDGIKRSAP